MSQTLPPNLDYSASAPAYRQIAEHFINLLVSGHLSPGDRLPTIHELARQVNVNPNTVVRAYKELEKAGLIEARPGIGTTLRQPLSPSTAEARKEELERIYTHAMREAVTAGLEKEEVVRYFLERITTT